MNQYIIKDILGIVNKYFCDSSDFIDNENYEKITNINNWDDGSYDACFKGHADIVNLMIENGANDCKRSVSLSKLL